MSSTSADAAYCASRRELRPVADLILVTPAHGTPYTVCRPSRSVEQCFRSVGPATRERIELLSSYLARREVSA